MPIGDGLVRVRVSLRGSACPSIHFFISRLLLHYLRSLIRLSVIGLRTSLLTDISRELAGEPKIKTRRNVLVG